jgi:hypothetical protein
MRWLPVLSLPKEICVNEDKDGPQHRSIADIIMHFHSPASSLDL